MASVDATYQTFKSAIAVLTGDGAFPSRVRDALELLKSLAPPGSQRAVFESPTLQSRFEHLLTDHRSDDASRAKEIVLLFEEVSAVYHVWMSQAGRSC